MTEDQSQLPEIIQEPRAFAESFIKAIRQNFQKSDVEKNLWISKSGLFVSIDYFETLRDGFINWYKNEFQVQITLEKAIKKLFENEYPNEYYIISGSNVVVGYLVPCNTSTLRGVGIRLYEGMPLDTSTNLHHTDPIFYSEYLEASLTKQGYVAVITTKVRKFLIPFDMIQVIRNNLKNSGDLRKYVKFWNLRRFLDTFAISLGFARPAANTDEWIMPLVFSNNREIQFFKISHQILCIKDDTIIDSFPIDGKASDSFIRQELIELVNLMNRRRLAGAYLSITKGSFLAHYDILQITHTFGVSLVLSFLVALHDYFYANKNSFGKLKLRPSVKNIVPEITGLLRTAMPCLPDKIPSKIKGHLETTCLVSQGEWYFMVDRAKMIRQVLYVQKAKTSVVTATTTK